MTPNNDELKALAETLAEWVEPAPGIPAIYLFGSRVRGDHERDADVDVRLYQNKWTVCEATNQWWTDQNLSKFAELKAKLPGTLRLHAAPTDEADHYILEGLKKPVLVVGKVVCVWTPNLKARTLPR
jgi:predicted nucleotidyltransferase